MSALMFTPSVEENVIDSSIGLPSCRLDVHTTFCTLVGNMMICSLIGL
jgi:hypothetical protein